MTNLSVARIDISLRLTRWAGLVERYRKMGYIEPNELKIHGDLVSNLRGLAFCMASKNIKRDNDGSVS